MLTVDLLHRLCRRWSNHGGPVAMLHQQVSVGMLVVILEEAGVLQVEPEGMPEPKPRPAFVPRPDCQHGCHMINDPDSDYRGCSCEGACLECHGLKP